MTIDPEQVAAAVGPRTRAIVPVHLYGQVRRHGSDPRRSRREHGLKVVEDCAQAHGATYRGRRAGTMGDAAAFSFYPTKNLGALGDAGAVVTADADVAGSGAPAAEATARRDGTSSVLKGTNSRLDALQAAFLSVKLRHAGRVDGTPPGNRSGVHPRARRDGSPPAARTIPGTSTTSTSFASPDRDRFRGVPRDAGVETLVHYPRAVHQHPAYADLREATGSE